MTTDCLHDNPRWVDTADTMECASCGVILSATTGLCKRCARPWDDHYFFSYTSTSEAPFLGPVTFPVCPRS